MITLVEKPKKSISLSQTFAEIEIEHPRYPAISKNDYLLQTTTDIVEQVLDEDSVQTTIEYDNSDAQFIPSGEMSPDFLDNGPIPPPISSRIVTVKISERIRPLPTIFQDEWDDLPSD